MSTRKEFTASVRKLALSTGRPVHRIYAQVYEQVQRRHGVNLYAAARFASGKGKKKLKPLDVAEEKGLLGGMLEIARNMEFSSSPAGGGRETVRVRSGQSAANEGRETAPAVRFISGQFVDTETGEILD